MGKEIKLRREEKKGKERGRKKKGKKKKKKGKKGRKKERKKKESRGLGKKIKRGGGRKSRFVQLYTCLESSGTKTNFSIHSPNLEYLLEGSILAVAIESNTGTKTWCLGMIDEVESLSKITMSFCDRWPNKKRR